MGNEVSTPNDELRYNRTRAHGTTTTHTSASVAAHPTGALITISSKSTTTPPEALQTIPSAIANTPHAAPLSTDATAARDAELSSALVSHLAAIFGIPLPPTTVC